MMTKPVKALVCLSGVVLRCLGASSNPSAGSMDSNNYIEVRSIDVEKGIVQVDDTTAGRLFSL
jgi:hypothetical protein